MSEHSRSELGNAIPPRAGAADSAWRALRSAARWTREAGRLDPPEVLGTDPAGTVCTTAADSGAVLLVREPDGGWTHGPAVPAGAAAMLDLYLPICNAREGSTLTVGHLGQSLDGYIATDSGDSNYVTGPANILHLHRMRALSDAVVVGAGTITRDDPQLTTRLAEGPNPVRVVLDPSRRLAAGHRVFADGQAETLLICDERHAREGSESIGLARVVGIPADAGRLDLEALLAKLAARGFERVFVEGGGATVSGFLEADLLDRLQIAIAPLVTGRGRAGIRLPGRQDIAACLRPTHRVFAMGEDVLFDCDLRAAGPPPRGDAHDRTALLRII